MKKKTISPDESVLLNDLSDRNYRNDLMIVGLGASAGGINALQEFFRQVPDDSGIAYVVILHLSPDYESRLAEVLQGITSLNVSQVKEEAEVQPNHVYVVPPNQHLTLADGHIQVSPNTLIEERRAPVDIFFRMLAEEYGPQSVAVILSGTGANGSMGLKRIKEKGGVVYVQNPREAEYSDMPRNAIATELVDEILNVAEIPGRIIAYKQRMGTVTIPEPQEALKESQQAALREVFTQLRIKTGHDFSNYKRETVLRRIERRINVHNLDSLAAYVEYMRETAEEPQALLKDLLISVTNFFRDKDAFTYLETSIIPKILQNRAPETPVKIWVAGCATGEEAYSIAMLFYERFDGSGELPQVQIFATDIDELSLSVAREGLYSINDAADVSPERLRRFFTRETDGYRIRRELREMILFANHNLIKDPPFFRLDLVTCRNLLIYLNQNAQNRVLETFHFALNPGAFMFLGSSESVDGAVDLYLTESKENHIYQSRQATSRPIPIPNTSLTSTLQLKIPKPENPREKATSEQEKRAMTHISIGDLHQRLLEQYAPPSVLVNENHDVVHLSEHAGRFMQVAGGEPSKNILRLVRKELRLELRTALYQAAQKRSNAEVKHLSLDIDGKTETINLYVRPVLRPDDTARGFILIIFEPAGQKPAEDSVTIVAGSSESITLQLEEELTSVKNQLRSSNEQFEVQTEELKASNEELQAMNEELRSAAEELEISKEELQSINEELITVNQELKIKIEEVSQSTNDFQNLMNSSDIGTIFLDRYFRIKLFTPAIKEIFNLIPADIGRPLSDITNRLEYQELISDADMVLKKLQTIEREVTVKENRTYLMQVSPYRTAEDRINGVVITFVDITTRRQAEEALRSSEKRFRAFVTASSDAIYRMNADWSNMVYLNSQNFMASTEETSSNWVEKYIPEADQVRLLNAVQKAIDAKSIFELAHQIYQADGAIGWVFSRAVPLLNDQNEIVEWFGTATNITARKQTEDALKKSEEQLQISIKGADIFTWEVNPLTGEAQFGGDYKGVLGFDISKAVADSFNIVHAADKDVLLTAIDKAMKGEAMLDIEHRVINPENNEVIWVKSQGQLLERLPDSPPVFIGITQNITTRKIAEEAVKESRERLRVTMESAIDYAIITIDISGYIEQWNSGAERIFGYSEEEVKGKSARLIFTPEDQKAGMFEKEMETAKKEGRAPDERWHMRRNGTRFYMSGVLRPIYNPALSGYVKVARDMTGKKKADEMLKLAEERYRIALQSAEMGAWDWNVEKDEVIWNDQHFALVGAIPERGPKNVAFFLQFLHPDDKAQVQDVLERALAESGVFRAEFRIIRADNKAVRWMSGYGRAVSREGNDRKATRIVGVMFDITERKKLQQQQEEFVGIASHELKTPVTSIKAYTELLKEVMETEGNESNTRLLEKLDGQVDRLTALIKALLDASRISEGQIPLTPEEFDLCGLVREQVEILRPIAGKHEIAIDGEKHLMVSADRDLLAQVINNLISNAVKYSPNGGPIKISCEARDDRAVVFIRDHGIGIEGDLKEKVFDRFFRITNASVHTYPGIGLGLYIAAGIIQRHGGTIGVESEPGKGSEFYFTLPYTQG